MAIEEQDNALISEILARDSMSMSNSAGMAPSKSSLDAIRDRYVSMEEILNNGCKISLRVESDHFPKCLVYNPSYGLHLCEKNGNVSAHWSNYNESMLAKHSALLFMISEQAKNLGAKFSASVIQNKAESSQQEFLQREAVEKIEKAREVMKSINDTIEKYSAPSIAIASNDTSVDVKVEAHKIDAEHDPEIPELPPVPKEAEALAASVAEYVNLTPASKTEEEKGIVKKFLSSVTPKSKKHKKQP